MKFIETGLDGAYVVEPEPIADSRGHFSRAFCANELREVGLDPRVAQCNITHNRLKGTLRGMHYQLPPAAENKVVRCTRGAIWDVIVDMRPESETFGEHFGIELSVDNGKAIYIPEMFAHGYLTLTDDADLFYIVSEFFSPGTARGLRWNDPAFGIEWPSEPERISDKDASWTLWDEIEDGGV